MRRLSDIIDNQTPLTLAATASVKEACRSMHQRRVGSVLVTDEHGRLAGIFTARDAVCRVIAAGRQPAETSLADVMTAEPAILSPENTAIDALRLMWDGGFRHVPVVHRGKIIGVVSRGDCKGDERVRLDEERHLWEHLR